MQQALGTNQEEEEVVEATEDEVAQEVVAVVVAVVVAISISIGGVVKIVEALDCHGLSQWWTGDASMREEQEPDQLVVLNTRI